MCGIAGFWDIRGSVRGGDLETFVADMAGMLAHRGPDGRGRWVDRDAGVALGHSRLSVIDLSETGVQPMTSSDGRFVITYNGEIYNFLELARSLEKDGRVFRGTSDTEVIVEACSAWGVRGMLERVSGMFAFALWDRDRRELSLARDRMGIKPLYWGHFGRLLMFGSELKALRAHPDWNPEIDEEAIGDFFRYLYVPSPRSVYKGIGKLPPGMLVTVRAEGAFHIGTEPYWRLADAVRDGQSRRRETGAESLLDEFEACLSGVVEQHMLADVPVGAFLSGGIDSSSVVAMMMRRPGAPVRTFSIGYRERGYDEAEHAAKVSSHLGTDHTDLYASPADALRVVPRLADLYDEPYADASQVPTALVSELARSQVTVVLSGDGGDELFGGYDRYWNALDAWNRQAWLPRPIARNLARTLGLLSGEAWERVLAPLPQRLRPLRDPRTSLPYARTLLGSAHIDPVHQRMVAAMEEPLVLGGGRSPGIAPWAHMGAPATNDSMERMVYFDAVSLLADGLLTKVDRASMAVGLEVRVPLLDHRLVEFIWRLPYALRFRRDETKWLLRQMLYRYVPPALVDRPKVGFHLPLREWLTGPLRDWAESLLRTEDLAADGLLDVARVRDLWGETLAGHPSSSTAIWAVLMYRAWRDRWMSGQRLDMPSAGIG